MAQGFGRKGVSGQGGTTPGFGRAPARAPTQPAGQASYSAPSHGSAADAYHAEDFEQSSDAYQAFLRAERLRKETQGDGGGLSDVAMAFGARAARTADVVGDDGSLRRGVAASPPRNIALAYVIWFFGGVLGAHRFYLNAFPSALLQLAVAMFFLFAVNVLEPTVFFPAGMVMIAWYWLDIALIPWLTRECNAKLAAG